MYVEMFHSYQDNSDVWDIGGNIAKGGLPQALTNHQRRKYLSNQSSFFSLGPKKLKHRPAHSHDFVCPQKKPWHWGNWQLQCLWKATAKKSKLWNKMLHSFFLASLLQKVVFQNDFLAVVGGWESHWSHTRAQFARAVAHTCDVYLCACGKLG